METNSTAINEILDKNECIVLGTHTNPDGDAICSTLAFAQTLKIMGKKPIVLIESYSDKYNFIKGSEFIYNGNYDEINPDVFIALDCGDKSRLGDTQNVFERAKITFNIDHHISNNYFGDNNIVNVRASSSSEIVFQIIRNFSVVNKDIASTIYTGIISDTSGFKHNSTTPETHSIVSQLIKYDIPFSDIQGKILYNHTIPEVKVFTKALQNLEIIDNISCTTLTKDEIKSCNATTKDLDGIVQYILNIDNVEASVFLYQKDNGNIKASLRSKNIDVNALASKHGGGGHKLAAGVDFNTTIEEAKTKILNDIKNEFK